MPKRHKGLFALSLIAIALVAVIGTSFATAPSADLSPQLPASALPRADVTPDVQSAIENLITPEAVEEFGITADSYTNIRKLTDTEVGAVYVVPGVDGVCAALLPSIGCGHPQGRDRAVAILVSVPSGDYVVGGGVLAGGISRVAFGRGGGRTTMATMIPGGFVVSAKQNIKPREKFEMSLQ